MINHGEKIIGGSGNPDERSPDDREIIIVPATEGDQDIPEKPPPMDPGELKRILNQPRKEEPRHNQDAGNN